jgi:hydrogenase/urease accessory protein HupE
MRLPALVVVLLVAVSPAYAHAPIPGVSGSAGGLLHPILVPSHGLSLLALGLYLGQQRGHRVALAIFASTLIAGLAALAFAVGETPAENVLLANTAVLGILLAGAWALPSPLGWLMAAIAGGALSLDSPPDATTLDEGNLMLLGTAVGACAGLAAVTLGTRLAKDTWNMLGVRVLGSWIAASAILVLALALAR